jgi:RimJ/RimL family protein N-acetyltransferase
MNNTIYNQKTNRLTLRKLGEEDYSFILELVNSEGWLKYIGDRNVRNENDSLKYIENIINNDKVIYLVVTLKDNSQIGIITLIKKDYLEFYDIGFAFLPSYNNNGYAYEASKVVLTYIEKSTDFSAILAATVPQNKSSIKLIEKLDLSFYKTDTHENEELNLYKMDLDKVRIDKLIKYFFRAFTNKGQKPNLKLLHETCIEETVFIKNTKGLCEKYNLESFIAPREELLTNGTLTEFEEYEIGEQTTIVRNIAQRLSHYQKDGILNKKRFSNKGTKIFQFVKIGSVWKVCCVIWDDE